ncbi:hypothetical protein EC9_37270 [Rosistilla ulvae]|uniref:CusB-like beta-barrel domain-containing protein n=1 Tax=Rosistilla ulvae TaxID=1930277 RepID=A0A517M3S5_9BACT|nr:HlyD family efflux transporter periplasmic adaptor subunit [Rosistilla ulvae]QDS89527.1 hypothetical protein EC9_37270 [Rosistilla ulvae]
MTSPPIPTHIATGTNTQWSPASVVVPRSNAPLPQSTPQPEQSAATPASVDRRFGQLQQTLTQIARDAGSIQQFADASLTAICRSGIAIGGMWHPRSNTDPATDDSEPLAAQIPGGLLGQPATQQWLHACRTSLATDEEPQTITSPQVQGLHATCIQLAVGSQHYAITLVAIGSDAGDLQRTIQLLPVMATAWHFGREAIACQHDLRVTAALVELVANVQKCPTLAEACQSIVDQWKAHLGCKFIALSLFPAASRLAEGRSQALRLQAISGLAHFDPSSPLAHAIESAHDECVLRECVTSWPPLAPNRRELSIAHRQIVESAGVELIASTPLRDNDGRIVGVLSAAGPFLSVGNPETQNLLTALSLPIGSVLSISRRAQPSRIRRFAQRIASKSIATQRNLLLASVGIVLIALCLPWPYRVACRCRLEPAAKRFAVAPYDGLLDATFVRPGDRVAAGAPLARMEQREINWELAGVVAQQERIRKTLDSHMANHETPKAMICEAELAELAARRQLLEYQRDNMEIRAPVAGLVLAGSLERREHVPVGIGEKLYEIAEISPLRVEVAIPAEDISHVEIGMKVQIRLNSERLQPIVGKLESIRPRSVVRENRNVFVAELTVANPDGKLRPGMEGDARIETVRHTLAWNWFHKPWERAVAWLSLTFT